MPGKFQYVDLQVWGTYRLHRAVVALGSIGAF